MRAAFVHNLSDAMASVVVIISGVLILFFETYWVDLCCNDFNLYLRGLAFMGADQKLYKNFNAGCPQRILIAQRLRKLYVLWVAL